MKKYECPVCRSKNTNLKLTASNNKKKYRYFICRDCSVLFLIDKAKNIYDRIYYERNKKGITANLESLYTLFSNLIKISLIKSNLKNKKNYRILDVGCGTGLFLSRLSKKFIKEGIELKSNNSIRTNDEVKINYGTIENFKSEKETYDVITMWHVLEHLDESRKVLLKINDLLKKDGLLIITTPNTDSFGFRLAKTQWYHFDAPYHQTLFNKKSLTRLANLTKFEVVSDYNYFIDFPFDLFWSILRLKKMMALLVVYPFLKLFSRETMFYVMKKR